MLGLCSGGAGAPAAKAKKKGGSNMGLVIGATAGVLVLGAGIGAAVAFGNIGATISNASGVFDGGFGGFDIGEFAGNVADCSCCDAMPCVVRTPRPWLRHEEPHTHSPMHAYAHTA